MPWPKIRLRGDPDYWSEATSLPRGHAGKDYERAVRIKLLGDPEPQEERDLKVSVPLQKEQCEQLMTLWDNAMKASRDSVGERLWQSFFPEKENIRPQFSESHAIETVTDIRLPQGMDLLKSLGECAECLFGNPMLPSDSIVEVTVNGARFFMKCFQVEKFLTVAKQSHQDVPGAAIIINKKPIDCHGQWEDAIRNCPHLSELHQDGKFCLLYWPHAISILQLQAALEAARAEQEEKLQAELEAARAEQEEKHQAETRQLQEQIRKLSAGRMDWRTAFLNACWPIVSLCSSSSNAERVTNASA